MKKIILLVICLSMICPIISVSAEEPPSVTITVNERYTNTTLIDKKTVTLEDGDTPFTILLRQFPEGEVEVGANDYVARIGIYAEKSFGDSMSGWKIYVNNKALSVGANAYKGLKHGDAIQWIFVYKKPNGQAAGSSSSDPVSSANTSSQNATSTGSSSDAGSSNSVVTSSGGTVSETEGSTGTESSNGVSSGYLEKFISVDNQLKQAASYLQTDFGTWTAAALAMAGDRIPGSIINELTDEIKVSKGEFSGVTDCERLLINAVSAGLDVRDIGGINLVKAMLDSESMEKQGINGPAYALIALSMLNEPWGDHLWNEQKLIDLILSQQREDGGFALTTELESDMDVTGFVLTALSGYKDNEAVSKAMDKALTWFLAEVPTVENEEDLTSESLSQVIIALCSNGQDILEIDGVNLVERLMTFQNEDGSFCHIRKYGADTMATEQAVIALSAYKNRQNPYSLIKRQNSEKRNLPPVVWIAVGAIALVVVLIIVIRRRSGQTV